MESEPNPASRLLRAIVNLAAFHRDHEKFYAASPRAEAVTLQQHARALQALADRWSTTEPARPSPFSPFEGAEDLNDPAAVQLAGVLFMEGEGEPPEITRMKRDLRTASDDALATGEWLARAMGSSWEVASALLDVPELADLLGERHRIIANDWLAASMNTLIGRVLLRSVEILDRVDFSPAALRADLERDRVAAALCYSAAELIGHAADLCSDSAGLVHDNERRWRVFRRRAQELVDREQPSGA